MFYGGSRAWICAHGGADEPRFLVLAIDEVEAATRTAVLVREQFPQIRIFARARSRQHVFALMDAGLKAKDIVRETYGSSLEMAAALLEASGQSAAQAREVVRRFRIHDEATLAQIYAVKEDDQEFLMPASLEAAWRLEEAVSRSRPRHRGVQRWTKAQRSVRDFWFGALPPTPAQLNQRMRFWFGAESSQVRRQRDDTIRRRFGENSRAYAADGGRAWAPGPTRRTGAWDAHPLLLDQFPRNIYRGSARAFAYDERALALTLSGMQSAADAALDVVERVFFYMPLQHAETREVQDESVAAYRRLLTEAPAQLRAFFEGAVRSAENHRVIIEQFEPSRTVTNSLAPARPPEIEWLQKGGASFGQ